MGRRRVRRTETVGGSEEETSRGGQGVIGRCAGVTDGVGKSRKKGTEGGGEKEWG